MHFELESATVKKYVFHGQGQSRREIKFGLETGIGTKVPVRTKERLRTAANDHMTMLENNMERVASYFRDPRIKYAA